MLYVDENNLHTETPSEVETSGPIELKRCQGRDSMPRVICSLWDSELVWEAAFHFEEDRI